MGEIANETDRVEYEKRTQAKQRKEDEELLADISAATGRDIQVLSSTNSNSSNVNNNKKRKSNKSKGNLTDTSKEENTSRKRLEKKLLNPKNLAKIGSILDSIERRQNYERFHHSFTYALQS